MEWKSRVKTFGALALATSGGVGYLPIAPGTWGTVVGVAMAWGMADWPVWSWFLVAALLTVAGSWAAGHACKVIGVADSGHVVIDEVAGFLVTMIAIPITPYWLVVGFVVFRILDIVKLAPASYFDQRVKNGWGVVMDDIVSGIYGNLLMHLMVRSQI